MKEELFPANIYQSACLKALRMFWRNMNEVLLIAFTESLDAYA